MIQSDEPFLVAGNQGITTASLIQYHSEQGEGVRGQEISRPLLTIDAAPRYGLVAATLMKYYGGDHHGQQIREPLHTITTKDRAGLLEASLQKVGQGEVQSAHLMELYGTSTGREIQSPLSTVTASGAHHAVIVTTLQQVDAAGRLGHWPEIRELLNRHCGYSIEADEILLIRVAGEWYFISDIGLRMLTPRELYSANGFPPDYIIDRDYLGNRYVKSDQVARCGNAVPPPFAAALVRANFPKWCSQPALQTMRQVQNAVAF